MELIAGYISQGLSFIIPLVILLGLLIFVHELGHFLVAKYYGVRVEVFSLGFGKKIFKFKRGDTTYCLSLVPFGGYVKMFGDDPTAEVDESEKKYAFNHKPVGQRIAVVVAGPLMNFFFAILLFGIIAFVGEQTLLPVLGDVSKESQAYHFGLRSGDKVTSLNGKPVSSWTEFQKALHSKLDSSVNISVLRPGQTEEIKIQAKTEKTLNPNPLSTDEWVGDIEGLGFQAKSSSIGVSRTDSLAYGLGLRSGFFISSINDQNVERWYEVISQINSAIRNSQTSVSVGFLNDKNEDLTATFKVDSSLTALENLNAFGIESPDLFVLDVAPDSPAAAAGIQKQDKIISIAGKTLNEWDDLVEQVQSFKPSKEHLDVVVLREGQTQALKVTPIQKEQVSKRGQDEIVYILGVVTSMSIAPPMTFIQRTSNPAKALWIGAVNTVVWSKATVISFLRLLQNKVSTKSIGGPIMIGQLASKTFQIGLSPFLKIMAIISINLFILNLLPVPVLDGGHLLFYTIEAIRGVPLSMRKLEIAQQIGLVILMGLMVFAIFNDVSRLFQ